MNDSNKLVQIDINDRDSHQPNLIWYAVPVVGSLSITLLLLNILFSSLPLVPIGITGVLLFTLLPAGVTGMYIWTFCDRAKTSEIEMPFWQLALLLIGASCLIGTLWR